MIIEKKQSGYFYPIAPEAIRKMRSRMQLLNPDEESITAIRNLFPIAEDFDKNISRGKVSVFRAVWLLKRRLKAKIAISDFLEIPSGMSVFFPDCPLPYPGKWLELEKLPLLGERFNFPERRTEYKPSLVDFTFEVDRGGHDGAANGGSYGWYAIVYSDKPAKERVISDSSAAQYGHRLNYHHDYKTLEITSQGTWLVVKKYYVGQIYDYPSEWVVYGAPPKDFFRYEVARL